MRRVIKLIILTFMSLLGYYILTGMTNRQILKRNENKLQLKYILIWTNPNHEPTKYLGTGQNTFEMYDCPIDNCYVTSNRQYLNNVTDFDAIVFHGPELSRIPYVLPSDRSPHQIYVFLSMESSQYYPIKDHVYRDYFNLTWTYKLNSDLYYGYMVIRNNRGDVIGPNETIHWLDAEDMEPIDDSLKEELSHKELAAAWFVSNCNTPSKREQYATKLKAELAKYNMTLDIFGKCGPNKCGRDKKGDCDDLIKNKYYFYLSFENSFSEDYVTEKLLTALLNNAVPIVYGGANYSRFMPDGAYLDARKLDVKELVQRMVDAIKNNQTYYNFFKWRNHYSYHYLLKSLDTNTFCKFCKKINKLNIVNTSSILDNHTNFLQWWNV